MAVRIPYCGCSHVASLDGGGRVSELVVETGTTRSDRIASATKIAVCFTWILVALRTIPATLTIQLGDRGIFVSVAERLLAGDRLYVDVWDNKDPLFFYIIAIGRLVSPWMDIVIELGWIGVASTASTVIAKRLGVTHNNSVLVGWAGTPFIVTGVHYFAGGTHLPGIAMALTATALMLSGRHLLSGAALGLLFFLKLPLFPVAVTLVVLVALTGRRPRNLIRVAVGLVASTMAVIGLLAVRGELGPYFGALVLNVGYANSSLSESAFGPLTRLIHIAFPEAMLIGLLVIAVLAGVAAAANSGAPEVDVVVRRSGWLTAGALASAILVLAATGLWWHHDQVLYVAAILLLTLLMRLTQRAFADSRVLAAIAVVSIALVLGGSNPRIYYQAAIDARANLDTITSVPPEAIALQRLSSGPGSYARIGTNDDRGHARGTHDWELACPRFHQYSFDSPMAFSELEACLPSAQYIVVSPSGQEWLTTVNSDDDFGHFVNAVRDLIGREYTCGETEGIRICVRHDTA